MMSIALAGTALLLLARARLSTFTHAPVIAVLLTALACARSTPQAVTPRGVAGPQSTAQAAAPPKAKVEVEDVRTFLAAQGIQVKSIAPMDPLSELSCAAAKHDGVVLADASRFEVSRFASNGAAQECLAVLHKKLGEGWPAVSQDYLVHGDWLVVTAWDLPVGERDTIQHAFEQAR